MARSPARSLLLRNVLMVLLACGWRRDAFSYLHLERVFPPNMTGNMVQLGVTIAQREWDALSRAGVALLEYIAGLIARKPASTDRVG